MFGQEEFDVRCEWGEPGVARLAPISDAVIVVDVLSFSTCVDVAAGRGAIVYPYRGPDGEAAQFAAARGAELAGMRGGDARFSLSPASLLELPPGGRLVLPSPNGSRLSLATGDTPTFAGCLRNYRVVAEEARRAGGRIAVIPAGERWPDGSLRPAVEDWIGAGAIISQLVGTLSPEARAALAAFRDAEAQLEETLRRAGSGKELIAIGHERDVALAAAAGASHVAPILVDGAYRSARP